MLQLLIGTILIGFGYGLFGIIISRQDGTRDGSLIALLMAFGTLILAGFGNVLNNYNP